VLRAVKEIIVTSWHVRQEDWVEQIQSAVTSHSIHMVAAARSQCPASV
jgi:hypothetical protein